MKPSQDSLTLYGQTFDSRLLLGTARYPSPKTLKDAVQLAKPGMLTASLRRQTANPEESTNTFWEMLRELNGLEANARLQPDDELRIPSSVNTLPPKVLLAAARVDGTDSLRKGQSRHTHVARKPRAKRPRGG